MITSQNFFLIVNPGLEDLAQIELDEKTSIYGLEIISRKITKGGIELQASLENGFLLNQILKIPTRILLRIHQSKVRDFPRLFKKIKSLPLNLYLNGGLPKIKASSAESRLIHSDRIAQTAIDGIKRYYVENAIKKRFLENIESDQNKTLYIRLINDELTISIDTSGESIYKRNQREYRAPGALRETFSAALFYDLKNAIDKPITTLFDPFAGSGTLLIEAQNFYKLTKRHFSYRDFPLYEKEQTLEQPKNGEIKLAGNEINKMVFDKSYSDLKDVDYKNSDSLKDKEKRPFIICNPPYGKQVAELNLSLNELVQRLYQNYDFDFLGILHPDIVKSNDKLKVISQRKFSNNSIDVFFSIIKKL